MVKIPIILLIIGAVSVFAMALPVNKPCKTNSALVSANNRLAPPKKTQAINIPVPSPPTQLPWGMFGNNSQMSAPAAPNSPTGSAIDYNKPFDGLYGVLNGGHLGQATAGGSGSGSVQNGQAVGQGTGIANAGPGGFGIGLGVGIAVDTPLGSFATGQGQSATSGK